MSYEYFYDGQLRRFLIQVVRAFSGFQYQIGAREGQPAYTKVVPCQMATMNRQVGHIIKNNSENTALSTPMITVWIKEMALARNRTQAPGFVSTVHATERDVDATTGAYTSSKGNSVTVERMMPHPLDLTIQVDVWTSNESQKHQLFEQIFSIFNVGFDIQSSENPIDWTALSTIELQGINWSSRSIPVGAGDEIDVMTFTFSLPVWISPPAKVKQQKLIHQIVTNVNTASSVESDHPEGSIVDSSFETRVITTPDNARIRVERDSSFGMVITLLGEHGSETRADGSLYSWEDFLRSYGKFVPAESEIRLRPSVDDTSRDIVGTIQKHPSLPNVLLWQIDVDTLPTNSLPPINGVIDPLVSFPGQTLPPPSEGQRYLLLNDIGPSVAWANSNGTSTLYASAGDIIAYQAGSWIVSFDASVTSSNEVVMNLNSAKQLVFSEGSWTVAIEGEYNPGFWRIAL